MFCVNVSVSVSVDTCMITFIQSLIHRGQKSYNDVLHQNCSIHRKHQIGYFKYSNCNIYCFRLSPFGLAIFINNVRASSFDVCRFDLPVDCQLMALL